MVASTRACVFCSVFSNKMLVERSLVRRGYLPYRRGLCENDNEIYDVEEQKRDVRERDAGKIKNAYQRCIVSRRNEGYYTFLGMASYYISITMLRPHTEVIF